MKYFLYCRKSSEDKKKADSVYSRSDRMGERGWHKTETLKLLIYLTDEQTGTKPGRKGFNEMMIRMQRGEARWNYCLEDRPLARNPIDEGTVKFGFMQGYVQHIVSQ
jgi:site-specific DNA recombinase